MLYKIWYVPTHPLYGALPGPYVQVWVTRGALVAHHYTHVNSQYHRTIIPLSVSQWDDLNDHSRWCGTGGFQEQVQCFVIGLRCSIYPFLSSTIFHFLFFLSMGWYCWAGVFGLIRCGSLAPSLALPTSFNNDN